jgi:hypothetical protein
MARIADSLVELYYYQRWSETKESKEEEAVCRRAAEMALHASRLAAPYVHARKLILEEDTPVAVNVVDRREIGRVINVNGNGSNGSNAHGSNGHGPNGNGSATDPN